MTVTRHADVSHRLDPGNANPAQGYVNDDLTEWIQLLEFDPRTEEGPDDVAGSRPARQTVQLVDHRPAIAEVRVGPGGAAYIDLVGADGVDGVLEIDVAADDVTSLGSFFADPRGSFDVPVRAELLAFDDHPGLCRQRVWVPVLGTANVGNPEGVNVALDANCSFATLVLTHVDPLSRADMDFIVSVVRRPPPKPGGGGGGNGRDPRDAVEVTTTGRVVLHVPGVACTCEGRVHVGECSDPVGAEHVHAHP